MATYDPRNTNQAGYQSTIEEFKRHRGGDAGYNQWGDNFNRELQSYGQRFNSLFENLVGRAATEDEAGMMYEQLINPNIMEARPGTDFSQRFQDYASEFIGNNYRKQAEEQANAQLQAQQGEATRLADLFRKQGNESISGVETSLMDYQSKLFERLRPQLLTSLQSQGLLNTGGLNQALAGQQADLANEASKQVADLKYQNDQAANAIAFGGEQAPYMFQQQNILNRTPQMQAQAQNALGRNFQNFSAQNAYDYQLGLINAQRQRQPSFLQQLGGQIAGNALSSFLPGVSAGIGNQARQRAGLPMPLAGDLSGTGVA
jgi:hypothetical protein